MLGRRVCFARKVYFRSSEFVSGGFMLKYVWSEILRGGTQVRPHSYMNTDCMYVCIPEVREIHFYRQLSSLKEFIVQEIYLLKTELTILKHIILVSLVSIANKSSLLDDIAFEYESMAIFICFYIAL